MTDWQTHSKRSLAPKNSSFDSRKAFEITIKTSFAYVSSGGANQWLNKINSFVTLKGKTIRSQGESQGKKGEKREDVQNWSHFQGVSDN